MKALHTILISIFTLLIISGCEKEEKVESKPAVQPAKVITVGGEKTELAKTFPGTVQASQRVDLAFQVQGRLVEFPVKDGQQVTKGSLLAKLDDRDYKSSVNAAQAELTKNQSNFRRAGELLKDQFISQVEYDRLQASVEVSTAKLEKATKALEDSQLIAPFSGVVAKTYVQNFQDVRAKQAILSLQDKSNLEISVNVSETLIARRQDGNTLTMSAHFDALPDHNFDLYVKEFSTEADPKTQTFEYILGIKETSGANILPGMTANVRVEKSGGASDQLVIVPLSAISSGSNGTTTVWKVSQDNKVSSQIVSTGELVGSDQVQLKSGLTNGEKIVVAGISALSEGMEIKPISEVKY